MIKYLLAFLLFTSPCIAGMGIGGFPCPGPGMMIESGFTCSETPFLTQDTHNSGFALGSTTSFYYAGLHNTGSTDINICAIEIYAREDGALTGKTLYVEKWSNNLTTLSSKIGDITQFNATLFSSTIGYYKINLGQIVTISPGQSLVFTFNETTGTTNKLTIATQGTDVIANQAFRFWRTTLIEETNGYNDMRGKLYGQ